MLIKNTPSFWNKALRVNKKSIISSPIYNAKNKLVIKLIKRLNPPSILDIGAGYGNIEDLVLLERIPTKLFGTDFAGDAVKDLNKRFGPGFKKSKLPNIPFTKDKFDCVLMLDVIEHIPSRLSKKTYFNINRVLKKNGHLIVSVPINESQSDTLKNMHHRKYDEDSIVTELKKNNFDIVNVKTFFAFNNFFYLKNFIVNIGLFGKRKRPNLAVILAQKK